MKKIFVCLIVSAIIGCIAGCCNSEKTQHPRSFTDGLTDADTTAVYSLVEQYMGHVIDGNFDAAVDMLVEVDPDDLDGEVWLLDEQKKSDIKKVLEMMPPISYEIVGLKFIDYNSNDVACKVYLSSELSTMLHFSPVKYLDQWYLGLLDQLNGSH